MNDSQTVKKTVMLAGRVPPEFKKRFAIACAHRGWKVQVALLKILEDWLANEEAEISSRANYKGSGAGRASAFHDSPSEEKIVVVGSPKRRTYVKRKSETQRRERA
jgi:hypothetical protein